MIKCLIVRGVGGVVIGLLMTASLVRHAAAQADGFSLNRYDAAERGSDWFWSESLDLRGAARPAFGAVTDWSYKPLASYDANGVEVARIVEHQLFVHLGASLVLDHRLRFGLSLPLLTLLKGEPGSVGGLNFTAREGAGFGDVRVGVDLRVVGDYGDAATLAIGMQGHLPTGSAARYSGDGRARLEPRLLLAGDIAQLAYAVRSGLQLRLDAQDFAGESLGPQLVFGGALGVRLASRRLLIGPELFGSTVISDSGSAMFGRRTTPLEAIFGAHFSAAEWRFGLGAGRGLTRGLGTPALRALASVEWAPAASEKRSIPAPRDSDRDGTFDDTDACPALPGDGHKDRLKAGCPADRDGDRVADVDDACPDALGAAHADRRVSGCPPQDLDHDAIVNAEDACPREPGVPNVDKARHGCAAAPAADKEESRDEDACAGLAPGAAHAPKQLGCPTVEVGGTQVVILDRIAFDTGKTRLLQRSGPALNAVLALLRGHPEIVLLSVEGHTDDEGTRRKNIDLSQRRAEAVVRWLVERGVDAARLSPKGHGPDHPIDTNETSAGRRNNRRVEFHIQKTSQIPTGQDANR